MTDDEELRKVFERYQKLLFKAANSVQSENPYSFVAEFSQKIDAANVNFKQLARRYIDKAIPDVDMSEAAQTTLKRAGAFHETANVKLTTYVQMVSKLSQSAEQFKDRIQAHIDEDEKNGKTTTVTDLKDYIKAELKTGRGTTVDYSNGARMPVDKYAEMLARTTRIETQNIAMLGKALDDGNDLVECSTISPTCPTCAMYQGRIYSISGNTPGYPALYKTAFRNGYSCIHPNCRHQFFPYNPKFHTAEERAQLEKDTRRPMDEEKQSDSARSAYARSQMQMRQWNKEMNEFAKMQETYGDNAPYKTLGAFRRAYRSDESSLAYAKTHYMSRDERQFAEFESLIGKKNMPETLAKFQELKYNDIAKFSELQKRVEWQKQNKPSHGHIEIPEGVSKSEFIQCELGVSKQKAEAYEDAISSYTGHSYKAIRAYQQGKRVSQEIVKIAENLEEYIKQAPRWNDGETFRGVRLTQEQVNEFTVGSTHDMKGMSSWSSEIDVAKDPEFSGETGDFQKSVIFHCPTQSKGTSIRHLSNIYYENEVLVSKESRYKVVGLETDYDRRIHIYLEEIC